MSHHPHHGLSVILALANAHKDDEDALPASAPPSKLASRSRGSPRVPTASAPAKSASSSDEVCLELLLANLFVFVFVCQSICPLH